ncbi:hypothetical protein PGT21_008460 [Puccinia graminis f. sp. tritici]|uniref:Major facilitator superfamily (MFS) profile domain-containing protein n=1 Tax=Puccinia graminis f. sp. tritici TaxID=56615 RepID=A0A5B0S8L4_PUCGR|nr:hypothetical protein PGT21_008460 [Puccinia graminis f. sp. tritici]KAA1134152.1 hypothetical protein PGTUg99_030158 [Puccinia graminis f. sp. tritici]
MAALEICDPEHPDHEAARASLIRKVDLHVLPGLSLLWLACFIDRTNIGNAKVGGMDHSLGLHGKQYNVGLAVFYITYILSELPSNYMLRIMGGKIWLPFLVASWGVITIFSGFMKNYASLLIIRLLLGLFEGGLLPVRRYRGSFIFYRQSTNPFTYKLTILTIIVVCGVKSDVM